MVSDLGNTYGGKQLCCPHCNQSKRPDEFTDTRTGAKSTCCKQCALAMKSDGKKNRNAEQIDQALAGFAAKLRGTHIDVPHISELAGHLIKKLGGVEQLAELWVTTINAIQDQKPASKLALESLLSVARLVETSTAYRESAPDMAAMTDADIQEELRSLILGEVGSSPRLLGAMAENAGLTVLYPLDAGKDSHAAVG